MRPSRKRRTRRRKRQRGGEPPPEELAGLRFKLLPLSFESRQVAQGAMVPKTATESAPSVRWSVSAEGAPYRALLCFDPDAPARAWLHWFVVNCTGATPDTGDTVADWEPPAPPSGVHRYYVCLFEHDYPLNLPTPKQRGYFGVRDALRENGLRPLQATMFRVAAVAANA